MYVYIFFQTQLVQIYTAFFFFLEEIWTSNDISKLSTLRSLDDFWSVLIYYSSVLYQSLWILSLVNFLEQISTKKVYEVSSSIWKYMWSWLDLN